ncbi:hypothetical protein, partial [Clavibacter michiganensis]|uniref:hypothetical protein n=1 Tax=Clavibacter michiganensis TaxID=28447 RepID=UPI00293162D0
DAAGTLARPPPLALPPRAAHEPPPNALPSDAPLSHGALGNLIAVRGATRRTGVDTGLAEFRDRALQRAVAELREPGVDAGASGRAAHGDEVAEGAVGQRGVGGERVRRRLVRGARGEREGGRACERPGRVR